MSRSPRLLVIGDANPDVIIATGDLELPTAEQEVLAEQGILTVGGSSAILACATASLGLQTAFFGIVGDDAAGHLVLNGMRNAGVQVEGCRQEHNKRSAITVVLSRATGRAILTAVANTEELRAHHVDRAVLYGVDHVHVGAYYLQPRLAADLPELFAEAQANGVSTSVDTNWDPSGRWDGLQNLAGCLDYLFVNEQEALCLARETSGNVEKAGDHLAELGMTLVVKLGARGARAWADRRKFFASAYSVQTIDTTGAGDNFDAGFLTGMLTGLDIETSLALGCACGALSTRALGGVSAQVTLEEARELTGRLP